MHLFLAKFVCHSGVEPLGFVTQIWRQSIVKKFGSCLSQIEENEKLRWVMICHHMFLDNECEIMVRINRILHLMHGEEYVRPVSG
jgi:hypothetical protein